MPTIETVYKSELRTKATHLKSGVEIITDAPTDNMGKGEAFSPTDLLAASLGSCMLTLMGITANAHGLNIDGTKISVTKIMASNPRRVSEIHIEMNIPGNFSDHDKKLLETSAITCPVAKSIHPDIKQEVKFHYGSFVGKTDH